MSDPITATLIAATVLGGGVAAAGSVKQGNANYAAGQYQAQIMERNQVIANANATDAINEGKVQEQQQRRQTAQVMGTQRAAFASLGQLVDAGTGGIVSSQTANQGEVDALNIRRQAEQEALGFHMQADQLGSDAIMQRRAASSARTSGFLGAGGTLLTTIGRAAAQGASVGSGAGYTTVASDRSGAVPVYAFKYKN